jgi:hypothetical protein
VTSHSSASQVVICGPGCKVCGVGAIDRSICGTASRSHSSLVPAFGRGGGVAREALDSAFNAVVSHGT